MPWPLLSLVTPGTSLGPGLQARSSSPLWVKAVSTGERDPPLSQPPRAFRFYSSADIWDGWLPECVVFIFDWKYEKHFFKDN